MAIVGDNWSGSRWSQESEARKRGLIPPCVYQLFYLLMRKGQYDDQVLGFDSVISLTDYAL